MLEARALTKHYGDVTALDALTLTVRAGEIVALLGANGAGKTTATYLFLGFVAPSSGTVKIADLDVQTHGGETRRQLAYIPERLALYGQLSGVENLAYFQGIGQRSLDDRKLRGFLERAGLDRSAHDRPVATYSKGMRQKVGIALAFAKAARALILDEPLSGLDPKAANEFCGHLRELRQDGVAILLATHDLFRAKETADRIGVMKAGKLIAEIAAAEVDHGELERQYLELMQ